VRVESRSECDTSVVLGNRNKLPVPRQHETVVDEDLHLSTNGFFYVMHRFDIDNVAFHYMQSKDCLPPSLWV
jgi:GMP reductase